MDIEIYFRNLVKVCIKRKMILLPLGGVGRQIIWMAKSREDIIGKSVLIVGGVHGDEPAGSLGILRFMEEADNKLFNNKLAFIPIVSPVAFKSGRRNGYTGRTNSGFVHALGDKPSAEGRVLLQNLDLLLRCSDAGFLTLHETDHEEKFYLYYYGDLPYEMINAFDMRDVGKGFFGCVPDGTRLYETGIPENFVRGGMVYKQFDGSLEHRLSLEGCPICICTETPGRRPLKLRVEATVSLIKKFIELRGGK